MATITDFDTWLDQADPDGHEEVCALYKAVADGDTGGFCECSQSNRKYFVKGRNCP